MISFNSVEDFNLDISGYDEAIVFAALYNHATRLRSNRKLPELTLVEAAHIIEVGRNWWQFNDRTLAIDFERGVVNRFLYDAANGEGAAQRAIDSIEVTP